MSDYQYAIQAIINDYYNCYIERSTAIHRLMNLGLTRSEADFEIHSALSQGEAA